MQVTASPTARPLAEPDLLARRDDDPWSLPLRARRHLRAQHEAAQRAWLLRLRRLVEPPLPADSFPAFLLALPPFARLQLAVGEAATIADLDVATADELQRFVDRYRHYLRDPAR